MNKKKSCVLGADYTACIVSETISTTQSYTARQGVDCNERERGKAVADKGAKQLRQTSPKRTGKYAKSWGVTREDSSFGENAKYIIHNKKHYRVAHLLEHGHVMANGKRTKAIPHIKPVEEQGIREYEKKFKNVVDKVILILYNRLCV